MTDSPTARPTCVVVAHSPRPGEIAVYTAGTQALVLLDVWRLRPSVVPRHHIQGYRTRWKDHLAYSWTVESFIHHSEYFVWRDTIENILSCV
jgi:hypothetical protein